jgi:hypothetical protein
MRSSSSEVDTPGVRRVGMNLPAVTVADESRIESARERRTLGLAVRVDVLVAGSSVRLLVVRDVVDLVLIDEGLIDDPRRLGDDLVNPPAVARGF